MQCSIFPAILVLLFIIFNINTHSCRWILSCSKGRTKHKIKSFVILKRRQILKLSLTHTHTHHFILFVSKLKWLPLVVLLLVQCAKAQPQNNPFFCLQTQFVI